MIAAYVESHSPEPTKQVSAEPITEAELLGLMRKHCQKSWQATRWLLEMKFPEKYLKREGIAPAGPSADQVLDVVGGVLAEEIADGALRARIDSRLDSLAAHRFVDTSAPAKQQKTNEDRQADANIEAEATSEAEASTEAREQLPSSEAPKPSDDMQPPQPGEAELPQPVELESLVEQPSREPADLPTAPVASPAGSTPLARLIEKPPPSPPTTWMAGARQQNEERKQARALRKQQRKKRRK